MIGQITDRARCRSAIISSESSSPTERRTMLSGISTLSRSCGVVLAVRINVLRVRIDTQDEQTRRMRPDHIDRAAPFSNVGLASLSYLLRSIRDVVEDVVERMAIQRLREPLLVEVVPHQADRTS